jgi:zinc protease
MSLRKLALAFLLVALAPAEAVAQVAPAQPQAAAAPWLYRDSDLPPDPAWRFGTLPNGVRYAVRRNARPERQVSIRVRIDAGSLHETPQQQGWAHLVEHLAFRGTANYADREARHIWQRLGASFGSDTNAFTAATQTVYQLDLPNADTAGLDTSLAVLADMMSGALFDPAAVEAERRIVIAERERRPELQVRVGEASRRLFYQGLRLADHETIGTPESLAAATAEGLRAFYRRWYRPERATIVMVGDADPAEMERLIAARFGGWRGDGPAPADPAFGSLAEPPARTAAVAYPGASPTLTVAWVRPFAPEPATRAEEEEDYADALAAGIINRRLERHARGESAFISAGVGIQSSRESAALTTLGLSARAGRWEAALTEAFAIIADALRAPPSAAEVERELANYRTALEASVRGEPTTLSQAWANALVAAVDDRDVVTTAADRLALFNAIAPQLTPERIGAAMQGLFADARTRLLHVAPEVPAGGEAALARGLAAAETAAPAARGEDRLVSFDALPPLGPPGREVGRERIEDLDVTIVRFANGSTLTFKPTRFTEGQVLVRLRFGNGVAGLDPARPSLTWASSFVAPSGVGDLDLDAMERLLTGRRIGLSFGVDEDAFILSGATRAEDLSDQMRLLAVKLAHPRWDPALFRRFQTSLLQAYDLQFASASARGGRELPAIVRPDDARWRAPEREALAAATPETFQAFFAPRLAEGPVHAVIVGDTDLEAAVAAVRASIAALPARAAAAPAADPARLAPPAPRPEPHRFTHNGDPAQAFAAIGWSTLGGERNLRARRALGLAANMLQVRLFDRLREEEGATYSPSASHNSSDTFDNWGIFYAGAEVRPERVDAFFRAAREIVADLAARPVSAEEFARAQNPVLSGIQRTVRTNGYWLAALEAIAAQPEDLAGIRSYLADYQALTPEEVRAAVAAHVADQGDWSMVVLPARAGSGGD